MVKPYKAYAKGGMVSSTYIKPSALPAGRERVPRAAAQPPAGVRGSLDVSADPFLGPDVANPPRRRK